jgi:hypothetical protein
VAFLRDQPLEGAGNQVVVVDDVYEEIHNVYYCSATWPLVPRERRGSIFVCFFAALRRFIPGLFVSSGTFLFPSKRDK